MKKPSDEKTNAEPSRRAKKRVYPLPQQPPISDPLELPEAPVLPDVYTKDRRSIHPTRKQQPIPSKKGKGTIDERS